MHNEFDHGITVIYPIFEVRGRAADRLRTWTQCQTLGREHYRVVAASGSAATSQEQEAARLLGPRDELVLLPGARDAALWNAGAAVADTPWLVFTEGHCLAHAECLEAVARWIAANPSAQAGNFSISHDESHLLGRLSRRWFDMIHARWSAADEWPRLCRSGCAIRADVFNAVGGFEPEYGQFAPALLSARLHEKGIRIGSIPGASVTHLDDERMRDHHADTTDYVLGELEARSRIDPVFFERYFGHAPLWANQLRCQPGIARLKARAVIVAAMSHPKWIAELAARSLLTVLTPGVAARAAYYRLAIAFDEIAVERLPLPAEWRWSRFLNAHSRVIRLAQLDWARRRPRRSALQVCDRWPIERLGPDAISGVHGLEERGGRLFRWTEPMALVRLAPFEGEYELCIETGGIRGDPLAAVIGVVVGGRVLPRGLLAGDEDNTLIVQLPAPWSDAARRGLILIISALSPAREGSSDRRLLGLPILSITTVPLRPRAKTRITAP